MRTGGCTSITMSSAAPATMMPLPPEQLARHHSSSMTLPGLRGRAAARVLRGVR
jgi:hypothetical protein